MNNLDASTTLTRGHVLHAHRTNRLFRVTFGDMTREQDDPGVYGCYITPDGRRRKSARRWQHIPAAQVIAKFQLYIPCRWVLECTAQGTLTVPYADTGTLTVCPEHARQHLAWQTTCAGIPRQNWPWEPEPGCWCPDVAGGRLLVDYCPKDGTKQQRGHNFGDGLDTNFATLNIDITERRTPE